MDQILCGLKVLLAPRDGTRELSYCLPRCRASRKGEK